MRRLLLAMTAWCALMSFTAAAAHAQTCGVGASCSIEDQGSDRFRITYVIANTSPNADVIFKWRVEGPSISSTWISVSFETPPGWDGTYQAGGRLDFQIPNGSMSTQRIYSESALACGGANFLVFRWTFDRNGGPLPDCGLLEADDLTIHVQGISTSSCDNVGGSFICPFVVPASKASWGSVKTHYR